MSRAKFLESARRCQRGIALMLLAVGLLSPAAALDDDATLSVPVVTDLPPLEWPACLVRPDVHPQILAIEAAVRRGDLDEAQRLVTAHAKGLRDAPAEARLDAQLAAAIVLDRAGDPQARRRFASVAEYAAAVGGLYSPHLLPARAGEGFAALRRGEALSAEESLTSALHLHRMRHGLHDPGQMVYLQALSALADGAAAEEQVTLLMRRQLALLQRQMLADDAAPGLLESLPELMTTLRNSTAFAALARPITELRFALQQKLDADDPALVPLLIADSHANALVAIAGESRWDARALREAYKLITSWMSTCRPTRVPMHWSTLATSGGWSATPRRRWRCSMWLNSLMCPRPPPGCGGPRRWRGRPARRAPWLMSLRAAGCGSASASTCGVT